MLDINYNWLKQHEPKLYWLRVLEEIAKDLNQGWVADWNNKEQLKYFIGFMNNSYIINYNYTLNTGFLYFKSSMIAQKAIEIMGDKLDYIFK